MDYLTNYYKNLSEQLQERINHLQNLLNEEGDMKKEAEESDLSNMKKRIGRSKKYGKTPMPAEPAPGELLPNELTPKQNTYTYDDEVEQDMERKYRSMKQKQMDKNPTLPAEPAPGELLPNYPKLGTNYPKSSR